MSRIKCWLCKKNHNIKPCPFCGSKLIEISLRGFGYGIECRSCGVLLHDISSSATEQVVLQAWNQRAK